MGAVIRKKPAFVFLWVFNFDAYPLDRQWIWRFYPAINGNRSIIGLVCKKNQFLVIRLELGFVVHIGFFLLFETTMDMDIHDLQFSEDQGCQQMMIPPVAGRRDVAFDSHERFSVAL